MEKRFLINILFAAVLLATLASCETIESGGPYERGDDYYENDQEQNRAFGPYDVMVFEHKYFEGRQERYSLSRDQRQVLVPYVGGGMNDRISSIRCGGRVGIALFKHRDFEGPMVIYDRSTDLVDLSINDWASSLIIFDLSDGGPVGAWIGGPMTDESHITNVQSPHLLAFLPLPENYNSNEMEYGRIGNFNDKVEWVFLGPAPRRAFMNTNYRDRGVARSRGGEYRRRGRGVEVFVYEHSNMRGRQIALPPRGARGRFFRLDAYGFQNIASSFVVREY